MNVKSSSAQDHNRFVSVLVKMEIKNHVLFSVQGVLDNDVNSNPLTEGLE